MTISEILRFLELPMPLYKADLKKSFRNGLLIWHPDRITRNNSLRAKARERIRSITEAYALLSRAMANEAERRWPGGCAGEDSL